MADASANPLAGAEFVKLPLTKRCRDAATRSAALARYQSLNPLDNMFYMGDVLRRQFGLPGVNILFLLELGGRLDTLGFRQALRALHRQYPVTNARLERSVVRGRPRWRLPAGQSDGHVALKVRELDDPTREGLRRQVEHLLRRPLDSVREAPLQFVLLRGLPAGDVLAMRWPHFLMDARGGAIVLEAIQGFYEAKPDLAAVEGMGDEDRDDIEGLLKNMTSIRRLRAIISGNRCALPEGWKELQLGTGPIEYDPGGLHYTMRTLDRAQTRRLRDISMRVCGFARVGDYVRASAIAAMQKIINPPRRRNLGYLTMQLVDNRKRRHRGPVCHNFFSALPVHIPTTVADDRRAVADIISQATGQALSNGVIAERFAAMDRLSKMPTSLLAGLTRLGMRSDPSSFLARGLANAPSLPMGFMGSFTRPLPEFCGATWSNCYGMGVILPHEGFGLNLNTPNDPDLLNVTATYFEPRVSGALMNAFLDQFVETLVSD